MTEKIDWYEGNVPPLKTGDKVFVADRVLGCSQVLETSISRVPVDVVWRDAKFLLLWLGWYDLQTMTFPADYIPPTWCDARYVFTTREAAEAAAWWWPVQATKEEWRTAIGDQDRPGSIATCELMNDELMDNSTLTVRDWLEEAHEWGGLREVDRRHVQELIDHCTNRPEALDKPDSVLADILKQLDLEWIKGRREKALKEAWGQPT